MATTITLASTNNGTLAASTLTLTSAIIGSSSNDRIVAVVAMGVGTVTSMSIGGISAQSQIASTGGASPFASIWTALVPTATSANIVVNSSVATGVMGFGIYAITTADSVTSSGRATTTQTATEALTQTIVNETSAKGLAGYTVISASTGTITWTNATASFQNSITTLKYGCATITTSGAALSVSASQAILAGETLVMATFGSTVPQTAVNMEVGERERPLGMRYPDRMVGY